MKLNDKLDRFNIVSSFTDNPQYDFGSYARGYHNAAKLVANNFLSQAGFRDYDGYPIVFLYRHAFELYLKNVIYWGARLSGFKDDDQFDSKLYNHHLLKDLAKLSTEILLRLFKDDKELELVIQKINLIAIEFSDLDKDSFSYRYPIDRKGKYSTQRHQVVNITSLTNCMEDLLTSIEVINFGLDIETSEIEEVIDILYSFSKQK